MALWEPANEIRKRLNSVAPIISLGLHGVYVFFILHLLPRPIPYGFFSDIANMIFPFQIPLWYYIRLLISVFGFALYFLPELGPYLGIKNNDLHIWPEHIMYLITAILISGPEWTGVLMWVQFVFVWILGDHPIWEAPKNIDDDTERFKQIGKSIAEGVILALYSVVTIVFMIIGFIVIFNPLLVIRFLISSGLAQVLNNIPVIQGVFGVNHFTGQPLLNILPIIGTIIIIICIFGIVDIVRIFIGDKKIFPEA